MNPLAFLTSGANSLIVILITAVLSFLGGAYLGHNYEKNYYEAKISSEKVRQQEAYAKALEAEQAKYNLAIGQLFNALQAEQAKSSNYQAQARNLFDKSSSACNVTFGFIRLFNASATGEITEPTSSDSATSAIDLATVLSTTIENHGKYRQAARQVEAIRAAE